ncbi:MAG: phosphate signaling complex protein PhoU [Syntrophorhabdus sp.]
MLQNRINELKMEITTYGALVEEMIKKGISGLLARKEDPLREIIYSLEPATNEFEIKIDDLCTTTIAQYQPRARDLRIVLMIYKMNNDLERMGDHAANIAESGLYLISQPPVKPLVDIPRMADETGENLKDAINAFITEDTILAQRVCERDYIIDALQDQIFRELITFMSSDPATIERSLHLIRIANNLERIADLSTNICEDVIFMVEGKVIKHHYGEKGITTTGPAKI